jgi:hypothetical protein
VLITFLNILLDWPNSKKLNFIALFMISSHCGQGRDDNEYINREIANLNPFDCVIAHNPFMIQWLKAHGLKAQTISLEVFDYLTNNPMKEKPQIFNKTIVFAGNLSKSKFIYSLNKIKVWDFNVYGPNYYDPQNQVIANLKWRGQYSPEDLIEQLDGNFGLIWDGAEVEKCDDVLGNYLRYNNPHKFSLYIAAGLPIIAPANSAIGVFIKQHKIGFLINSLLDLDNIPVNEQIYLVMKSNVIKIQKKVTCGDYLTSAITLAEKEMQY